ncbi:hypothetical protein [Streptomyces albus]|uniref:hypothetical protein n=1 Tax=Streptomyces albus TaxID=1888 RepID=UPI003451FFA4
MAARRVPLHGGEPGTRRVPPAVTLLLDRAEPGLGTSRWSLAWLDSNGVPDHSGATLAAGLAEMVVAELLTGRPEPALEPYRPTRLRRD